MCRNSVQERRDMKKKIILFLLAVFLFFALLVAALCFFSPKENQDSKKDMTGQQDTAENTTEQPAEEREQFHFTNLEYIYYINSDNEADLENQAAEYVEKNYKDVHRVNALAKFDDNLSSNEGTATFYLQLDDEDHSIVLVLYDKKKKIFSFSPYKKQIKNIEIYGGMSQEKNTMQDDEEDYNEIGTEPINLGEPNIVDQDDSLDAVADEKELSQELLKFLEKEGEERRNFYVASVESTGEKDYKAVLDFSTKRSDGKNITVTFEDGTYTFSLK